MSHDHQLYLQGENFSMPGPRDLNSGSQFAMLRAAQMQEQQNQLFQDQGAHYDAADFGGTAPSQQAINETMYGMSMGGGDRQSQQQLDFQQELKRLNFAGAPTNALLNAGNNSQTNMRNNSNLDTTALLQSLLLEQQQKNNLMVPTQQGNVPGSLPDATLQQGLLQDPLILMAQNQLASFRRQLEVPLPSPHSLFHRDGSRRMRGGVIEPYPEKLHRLLSEVEAAGRSDVISWVAQGRAFVIHKPDKFFKEIVPLYFRQSRLSSFKRQLNLYGFELINSGPARGGYFHELFVKNHPELCRRMRRVAVKLGSKKEKDNAAVVEEQHQSQTETQSNVAHTNLHP